VRQVSLGPVWTGSGSRLREGVEALPPSVTSLALLPLVSAKKDGGVAGGSWRLRLGPAMPWGNLGPVPPGEGRRSVPAVLELCAAFDRPGLPCGLEGTVDLLVTPPTAEAGPEAEAHGDYLGQCAELASRLRSGGAPSSGVELVLEERGQQGGDMDFLGLVLDAMLPGAAPHLTSLRLLMNGDGWFPPDLSDHLTAPAFPLLRSLELDSEIWEPMMEAEDVEALARLAAPRLRRVGLLCPAFYAFGSHEGTIFGRGSTAVVRALAMGLPRPVDAEGRPAGLELFVGVRPSEEGDERELDRALAQAGRGCVRVVWLEPDMWG
jgi:hypothetical protein